MKVENSKRDVLIMSVTQNNIGLTFEVSAEGTKQFFWSRKTYINEIGKYLTIGWNY